MRTLIIATTASIALLSSPVLADTTAAQGQAATITNNALADAAKTLKDANTTINEATAALTDEQKAIAGTHLDTAKKTTADAQSQVEAAKNTTGLAGTH
jgi:hypothetical protein